MLKATVEKVKSSATLLKSYVAPATETETVWISEPEQERFDAAQLCFRALAKMPGFNNLSLDELRKIAWVSFYKAADQTLGVLSPHDGQILARQSGKTDVTKQDLHLYSNSAVIDLILNALVTNNVLCNVLLARNDLNDEVAQRIAELLKVNQTITGLDLSHNPITAKGWVAIFKVLIDVNRTLQSLTLRGNDLGLEGVQHLATKLSADNCLQTLKLDYIKFTQEELKILTAALVANKSVKKFSLSNVKLGLDGRFESFLPVIAKNQTLQHLNISSNELSYAQLRLLLATIKANSGSSLEDVNQIEYQRRDKLAEQEKDDEQLGDDVQSENDEQINPDWLVLSKEFAAETTTTGLFFSPKLKVELDEDWSNMVFSDLVLRVHKVTRPKGSGELTLS